MQYRPMTSADIDAVVRIHQIAFKGFFLTKMGPRFLRAYYQTVLNFDAGIALVALDHSTQEALGFAVGFHDPQGFYKLFGQRRKRLLPSITLAVIRNPSLVPQILSNKRRVEARAQETLDAVELSSIAVGTPGRGVGGALLEAFATKAHDAGSRCIVLTTDAEQNDTVRGFYEARGFILQGFEDRGERRLCHYTRLLG